MPLYDYTDANGHTTESRQGIDVESIPCPVYLERPQRQCRLPAYRQQVYRDQFMQAETGPAGGKKNEVPPSDIRLGQQVSEYVEAASEVAYAYEEHERQTGEQVKMPNLYEQGVRRAKRLQSKQAAGGKIIPSDFVT